MSDGLDLSMSQAVIAILFGPGGFLLGIWAMRPKKESSEGKKSSAHSEDCKEHLSKNDIDHRFFFAEINAMKIREAGATVTLAGITRALDTLITDQKTTFKEFNAKLDNFHASERIRFNPEREFKAASAIENRNEQ